MTKLATKIHTTYPSFIEDLPNPIPLSYNVQEISKLLDLHINLCRHRGEPAPPNPDSPFFNNVYRNRPEKLTGRIIRDLESFYKIIDDAFFFGALSQYVNLKIYLRRPTTAHMRRARITKSQHGWYENRFPNGKWALRNPPPAYMARGYNPERPTISLFLFNAPYPSPFAGSRSPAPHILYERNLRWGVGIILHEMIHAFLDIFSCRCSSSPSKCIEEVEGIDGIGLTGHGQSWAHAMDELMGQAEGLFGIGNIDCNLTDGLVFEMEKSGWVPTKEQIKKWGRRYEEEEGESWNPYDYISGESGAENQ